MYIRDRVIVLSKDVVRETDRRYVMYGREHGLLTAVARGSSTPKSKQAGHLEPFCETDVMIAEGTGFDKLAVASSSKNLLRASQLPGFIFAGTFVDVLKRFLQPGISDERIFLLLQEVCRTAEELPSEVSERRLQFLLSASQLRLLDLVGFAPVIERASEGTSPVPHLAIAMFCRKAPLTDVLRLTADAMELDRVCQFVDFALRETSLEREPHGRRTIRALA